MTAPDELIELDGSAQEPLYQQIKSRIVERIERGEWVPGRRLPSENQLVRDLEVSRMTVHRALRELTTEGRLRRVHGVGTFVSEPPRHASLIRLSDIADEIRAQGHEHHAKVLRKARRPLGRDRARRMESTPGKICFHVQLVHYQDKVPVQWEDRWVNPDLVPGFLDQDFARITPTRYLIESIRPDEMEHIVEAVLPPPAVRRALSMAEGEPCLKLNRRTWSGTSVVTSVAMLYPGSRYRLGQRYIP